MSQKASVVELGSGQQGKSMSMSMGMKGDAELWFKAGDWGKTMQRMEIEKKKEMQTWLNLSPSGCLHSHDILKGESGIESQQATSVTPLRWPLLMYYDAELAGDLRWGFKGRYE